MKFNVLFMLVLFSSCLSTRLDYLPTPDTITTYNKGHYFEGVAYYNSKIFGEMLYISYDTLVILNKETGIKDYTKREILKGEIILSLATNGNERDKLKIYNTITTISPFTHGWWFIFSGPINYGVNTDSNKKSSSGTYRMHYELTPWEKLNKFCRFPQGLPQGVDKDDIKYVELYPASERADVVQDAQAQDPQARQ